METHVVHETMLFGNAKLIQVFILDFEWRKS